MCLRGIDDRRLRDFHTIRLWNLDGHVSQDLDFTNLCFVGE
jgi:hypothetical protein